MSDLCGTTFHTERDARQFAHETALLQSRIPFARVSVRMGGTTGELLAVPVDRAEEAWEAIRCAPPVDRIPKYLKSDPLLRETVGV